MNLTINATTTVFLQAMSLIFDQYAVYVQWQNMIQDETNTWVIDQNNPNCIVGEMVNTQAGMMSFLGLAFSDKIAAITSFIQTQYPN